MSREVIRIETDQGAQLWVGGESSAYSKDLEAALAADPAYAVLEETTIDQCFGPLSITQEIRSNRGTFTVKAVMEGYDPDLGLTVDASESSVIDYIYGQMLSSGLFHGRD